MTDQMQKLGHRESPYSRPTQKWRCGHRDACKAGPGLNGECPLTDNPCSPIPSVRAHKRRIVYLLLGIAFSLLAIFLTGKTTLDHLSPGPLSVNHAEVTSCTDCHAAVSETIFDWVNKAIHLNSNSDDEKCLSCHMLGENASLPHSTSSDNFSKDANKASVQSSSALGVSLASHLRTWKAMETDNISCAVCHREHQGKFVPIDGFDPQQCHVCHTVKFAELKSQHPQYTDFPYKRPTRIRFDHVTHLKKHFVEDEHVDFAPDGCKQCHDTDQSGEWMLSNTFEASCSSCHLQEVLGDTRATAKGVAVLSIPELDIQSLSDAGYYIGQWPEWADGETTPFMQLLLPEALQESAALRNQSLELFDLSAARPGELASVAQLAWGIKELFYDIQMGGTAMMNRRIDEALEGDFDQSTLNHLVASLPKDTLVNNQKEWFPMLMEEVGQFRAGEIEIFTGAADEEAQPDASEEIVIAPEAAESQDILIGDDDSILLDDDFIGDAIFDGELVEAGILDDDEIDLLTEDDGVAEPGEERLMVGEVSILLDDDEWSDAEFQVQTNTKSPFRPGVEPVEDNEEWAHTGGWYRDGSTIYYRPIDHADPFLRTWLDVSSVENDLAGKSLFRSLSGDEAVGKCVKCHSVEATRIEARMDNLASRPLKEADKYRINWHGFMPGDVEIDFNRFSHVAHFGLMNDDGCSSCHKLNAATADDPDIAAASFVDMDRETCTQCHQQGRAPDSCLTCHNYHAESYPRSIELITDYLRSSTNNE